MMIWGKKGEGEVRKRRSNKAQVDVVFCPNALWSIPCNPLVVTAFGTGSLKT